MTVTVGVKASSINHMLNHDFIMLQTIDFLARVNPTYFADTTLGVDDV